MNHGCRHVVLIGMLMLLLFNSQQNFQNFQTQKSVSSNVNTSDTNSRSGRSSRSSSIKVDAFSIVITNRRSSTRAGTRSISSINHCPLLPSIYSRHEILPQKHSYSNCYTKATTLNQQSHDEYENKNNDENCYPRNNMYQHKEEQYSVVIGKGSILNLENDGTLTFSKSLLIEGTLIGKLQCTCLDSYNEHEQQCIDTSVIIGQHGELRAHVVNCGVWSINVQGRLIGDVHCDKLVVGKHGVLIGDIKVRSISIEEGATIIGSITCGVDVVPELQFHNISKSTPSTKMERDLDDFNNVHEVNAVSHETVKVENHEEKNGFSNKDVNGLSQENLNGIHNEDVNGYSYEDRNGKSSDKVINDLDKTNGSYDNESVLTNHLNDIIEANGVSKEYECNGQKSHETNEPNQDSDDGLNEKKEGSVSQNIGNIVDHSKNVIIPVANGIESKNGVNKKTMLNGKTDKGRNSDMFDDFGNPLFHSPIQLKSTFNKNGSSKKRNQKDNSKSNNNINNNNKIKGNYVDEFGNPLIRGADDDELAGYRQIREMSAVTRELLDAHIREKKKKVIEKAARATPQARISRQLNNMQKNQKNDEDIDNNDMPSFLR